MFDLLIFIVLGIAAGIISGLIPGIHPNLFAAMILSISFLFNNPLYAAVFLVSAAVVNSFVCYIPSIFLGAPDPENALSILPGHKLLLQGRGYEAVKLTAIGGLGSAIFSILILPLFWIFIPEIYYSIKNFMGFILIAVVIYMLFKENKKAWAVITFSLSGILGMLILNSNINNPLLPLLTGLFGLPIIFLSIIKNTKIPNKISFEMSKMNTKEILSSIGIGSIAGIITGLLPGIGSSQAALISQQITRNYKNADRNFLISIGGVNTSNMIYSLYAILLISKPRSGVAVAVNKLMNISLNDVLILTSVILVTSILGYYITVAIARRTVFFIRKIDYRKLNLIVFSFLIILITLISGIIGLIIAIVSMFIGLIPNLSGARRSWAMGCLLIPTIVWFLF